MYCGCMRKREIVIHGKIHPKEAEKHKQKTCFKYLLTKFVKLCGFLRLLSNKNHVNVIPNIWSVFWCAYFTILFDSFVKFWKKSFLTGAILSRGKKTTTN